MAKKTTAATVTPKSACVAIKMADGSFSAPTTISTMALTDWVLKGFTEVDVAADGTVTDKPHPVEVGGDPADPDNK